MKRILYLLLVSVSIFSIVAVVISTGGITELIEGIETLSIAVEEFFEKLPTP